MVRFAPLVLLLPLPLVAAQEPLRRPMTIDDSLRMVSARGLVLAPDGGHVLYSKRELDWKENGSETEVWLRSLEDEDSYRYIGEAGGSGFQYSPDGAWLGFTRSVEGKSQLFRMRTSGGEAVQLSEHATSIGAWKWSADSSRVYFTANAEQEEEPDKGDDAIVVDEGPNGQTSGEWRELWVFDVATKEETVLVDGPVRVGSFDPAPDGSRVVYSARFENRRNQQYKSELWIVDVADRVRRRLTDNNAPESNPLWAPDGSGFVFSAPALGEWELRLSRLWWMEPNSGEVRLASGEFQGNLRGAVWQPDSQHVLFLGQQGVNTNLFRLDVYSGDVSQLSELEGSLGSASYSADRSLVAFTYQDYDTPADVYWSTVESFSPQRLTELNEELEAEIAFARGSTIRWNSADGLEVEGVLYLPASYREGQRLPLMLNIHGGPAGSFQNSFRSSNHVWAGLGYVLLCPNVRGSSGYTDELLRGNMNDIGGGDYQDLMTGVDHLIELGYVDPERMGVRGWSYGGILGGWTITQTQRFQGASLGAMVSDWTSEYGPGFNHDVRLWYIGGTPWDNPEGWRQRSALTHIANVQTPTILFHGMSDRTDTEPQSMMYFQALKDRGVECRYLRFPREGHGIREPRHRRALDAAEITWMQLHVLGEEWDAGEFDG